MFHPRLMTLRALSLEMSLNPCTLTILPSICPNLRHLYLHKASIRLNTGYPVSIDFPSTESAKEFVYSKQKAQLIAVLDSLPFTPIIELPSQYETISYFKNH